MKKVVKVKNKKINIAILGCGVVGGGVYNLCKTSKNVKVLKVLDKRPIKEVGRLLTYNIDDVLKNEKITLVVETIGGLHPAYEFAKKVIKSGKHFVTANKMLVGVYGEELLKLAYKHNVGFLYSAGCGGGIPILQNIKHMSNIDDIESVGGILNGTTNFILDKMHSEKIGYLDALKQAQQLGYAENDPSNDVEGKDTAYKITLSCCVAYNIFINIKDMNVYGISTIKDVDIKYAQQHNASIRLCGYIDNENDKISAVVEPVIVADNSMESSILKNLNYAWYKCKNCGTFSFIGQGAGRFPTASNVVRDILSIQNGVYYFNNKNIKKGKVNNKNIENRYYVRLPKDKQKMINSKFIYKTKEDSKYVYIITKPILLTYIHNLLLGKKDCFFAKIDKNVEF